MLTFLVGGARSGKSTLAVRLAEHAGGPVTFLATATALDDEMAERITRHRDERPEGWTTVEEPVDLAPAIAAAPPDATLVVDCLTVWLGNLSAASWAAADVADACDAVAAALRDRRDHGAGTIVVSNEVGLGIIPADLPTRHYRDQLGRLNQAVADIADVTLFLVAGKALRLESPWALLR
jgi:adenosylcobinamide kinase/adenosylcobinamide-phosphate guanylyltransferase